MDHPADHDHPVGQFILGRAYDVRAYLPGTSPIGRMRNCGIRSGTVRQEIHLRRTGMGTRPRCISHDSVALVIPFFYQVPEICLRISRVATTVTASRDATKVCPPASLYCSLFFLFTECAGSSGRTRRTTSDPWQHHRIGGGISTHRRGVRAFNLQP